MSWEHTTSSVEVVVVEERSLSSSSFFDDDAFVLSFVSAPVSRETWLYHVCVCVLVFRVLLMFVRERENNNVHARFAV